MPARFRPELLVALQRGLAELRAAAMAQEHAHAAEIEQVPLTWRPSARNLLHYLAVRSQDLRPLQRHLARLGLSSLGRMEANVLDTLDAVQSALRLLSGGAPLPPTDRTRVPDLEGGQLLLADHTRELLGPGLPSRPVRIMVTLPSEAADDAELVARLVGAGMDIARINLAHDGPEQWTRMVAHVRQAARAMQRPCRIHADLAGPKLRTGAMAPGPAVLRVRPRRNELGEVVVPARLFLHAAAATPPPGTVPVPIDAALLPLLAVGDQLRLRDHRGRPRRLQVVEAGVDGCIAECERSAYLRPGTMLRLWREGRLLASGQVGQLPALPGHLLLAVGDEFLLTRDLTPGQPGAPGGGLLGRIPCELPAVFERLQPDDRLWFDDGKLGGKVVGKDAGLLRIQVTEAPKKGFKLRAGKGINVPHKDLAVSALTGYDRRCLDWACAHVDLIGLSFAGSPDDVRQLHDELVARDAAHLGVVLKIETARAFERLPAMLLAGLASPPLGVMVARGDLAVEVGFARLAEVQEEILWLCEAAHVPVIWATQVLETMAKTGQPSRAEVTDAAMAVRAECVMLNKGPFAVEAVRFLGAVLGRMQAHQEKKRSMLRRLMVVERYRGAQPVAAEPGAY